MRYKSITVNNINVSEKKDKYGNKFWFYPCPICGKRRWIKNIDSYRNCNKCANKITGKHRLRENNPCWKGKLEYHYDYPQYNLIFVSRDDPLFCMVNNPMPGGGYVYEHRLVMARHLGRPLLDNETVHHINGIITDNRLSNMKLHESQGNHLKEHFGNGDIKPKLFLPGHIPWNTGLTKETDSRLASISIKNKKYIKEKHKCQKLQLSQKLV